MAEQNKGLKRDPIDKFYTSPDIVTFCIDLIREKITISADDDICIEPSAGNGAFIEKIKELTKNYEFYDISPENEEIKRQDFLELETSSFSENFKKIHIIGNPPFGRQSSLAIKFIRKSCSFCDSISLILPKSFKKNSMKKYFPLKFALVCECDLPEDSFIVNGEKHNVPCIFQIWQKTELDREIPQVLEPKNFSFVKKTNKPSISFRRVGVYAGKIEDNNFGRKSAQSHYFIKFDPGIFTEKLLNDLKKIEYNCKNDTVGPRSISKQELIKEFNQIILNQNNS